MPQLVLVLEEIARFTYWILYFVVCFGRKEKSHGFPRNLIVLPWPFSLRYTSQKCHDSTEC